MKSVKEIKEMRDLWYSSPTKAFEAFTDALIGITEHLEDPRIGGTDKHGIRWTCKFVDPHSGPSDADMEARREHHEHIDENGNLIDVGAYSQQLRRAAWIEALRWADRVHATWPMIRDAITRLASGGDL